MKYWEFLIQKEGDQTWLPLETQQVEILEGRYRVVAHTDRANTSMEVRVSQLVTDEMPPRRRVRTRVSTTNDSGLVVAMPFVNLQPGQWDLKCSSLEGAIGEPWQYSVQLQVFAHTEEDWSNEWPVPNDDETTASVTLEGEGEIDPELINQDLPLIQAQAELEANLPSDTAPKKVAEVLSYQVALKQQAYLAHPKLPMTIVGRVSSLAGSGAQESSQLWIRLQNPETAKVIMEASRPLSLARLPADFKVQIQLPAEVSTRVILGEVSLRSEAFNGAVSDGASDGGDVLAATSFTISAGIAELLEAIANQDTDTFSGVFEEEVISMPSLSPVQTTVSPAVGVVLPPKLDSSLESSDYSVAAGSESLKNGGNHNNGYGQPALPDFANSDFASVDAASNLIVSDAPNLVGTDVVQSRPVQPETVQSEVAQPEVTQPEVTQPDVARSDLARSDLSRSDSADSGAAPVTSQVTPSPVVPDPAVISSSPREPLIERAPMVAQPAQFLGTSVEDSDIEADEIAALLEDIDKDLSSEETDLDALEAPGIEAALPKVSTNSVPRNASLTDEQTANLEANEAAREANRRSPREQPRQSPRQIEASLDFQALRLKDHFWNRLSNLTHESHKEAAQLAERMREAGVNTGQSGLHSSPAARANSEVVIYNDPVPAESSEQPSNAQSSNVISGNGRLGAASAQSPLSGKPPFTPAEGSSSQTSPNARIVDRLLQRNGLTRPTADTLNATGSQSAEAVPAQPSQPSTGSSSASALLPSSSASPLNPEDLPEMALPVISVPMGDLVAGEIITVTVRTRPSVYKPFIKLWMVDRQSRSLVIDPKLLTNMTPDALGDLETSTQLQIPMHCLDVQIAAIAIDMATQQESAKAIVNRHVVPADQASPVKGVNL